MGQTVSCMSPKLSNSIIVIGGIASAVIILGFFGVTADSLRKELPEMTAHFWWLSFWLIVSLSAVAFGLYQKLKRPKVTIKNVESKVREWSDSFGFGITKISSTPQFHFGIKLLVQNVVSVSVFRTLQHPQYLTMIVRMVLTPEQLPLYEKLEQVNQDDLVRELRLELARAKIGGVVNLPESVIIERLVPITDSLTESAFLDEIQDMQFSVILGAAVIEKKLKIGKPSSGQLSSDITSPSSQT